MAEVYFYTTRDQVEVVRCKDCKNFRLIGGNSIESTYNWCVHYKAYVNAQDFCSRSEKIENIDNVEASLHIELKPCPFCGCGGAGTKWHHGYWSVMCGYAHDCAPSKHCFQDWGEFETEEEAINAWNTREI